MNIFSAKLKDLSLLCFEDILFFASLRFVVLSKLRSIGKSFLSFCHRPYRKLLISTIKSNITTNITTESKASSILKRRKKMIEILLDNNIKLTIRDSFFEDTNEYLKKGVDLFDSRH